MTDKILTTEYLQARGAAYEARLCMDPAVADFIGLDDVRDVCIWLAFMAGSDWERKYRGRRYTHELTATEPHLDMKA